MFDTIDSSSSFNSFTRKPLCTGGESCESVGKIEIAFYFNKLGLDIAPADIFMKSRCLEIGLERCVEVCGIPFRVDVVENLKSKHEIQASSTMTRWDASLNI